MSDAAIEARFRQMRDTARSIFRYTLDQASIANGFSRHVHCERGVMRVCEDLYDLHSYSRVVVISFGKAAQTMVEALVAQVGISVEGIVASSVPPASQLRGFRYFRGGHPTPNQESIQAAGAMLRALESQNANSLAICAGALRRADRGDQCHSQALVRGQRRKAGQGGISRAAGLFAGLRCSGECSGCAGIGPNDARFHQRGRLLSSGAEI
ncbi:MAG: hypothetical protein DMG80_19825 [Acidobacteria bacterium]|nr:MAG: hypothetical protein DMG80_19825 [Acidobacteriota bacterium]